MKDQPPKITRGQFRPRTYADGSTEPPKPHRVLTDEDWDALLADPTIEGILATMDPTQDHMLQLIRKNRKLHHELEVARRTLFQINVALFSLQEVFAPRDRVPGTMVYRESDGHWVWQPLDSTT